MANQLLLSLRARSAERSVAISYDDQSLIADLADALGSLEGGAGAAELIVRSRDAALAPGMRISESDLQSGDTVQIQWITQRTQGGDGGELAPAQLRFVSGQTEGSVVPLRHGVNTLGRGSDSGIPIDDGLASRYHVAINVTDVVSISDLGSTNGTTVNGEPVAGSVVLGPDDVVEVGDTRFVVVQTSRSGLEDHQGGSHVRFNRPPRVVPPYEGIEVEIPAPPGEPPRQRLPMVAAILPVLLAVFMYLLTRNVASILFMAMSPLMMLGSYWENKRGARASYTEALADWRERVGEIVELLVAERDREIVRRCDESPSLAETRSYVETRSTRLWERGLEETDFLSLRVGIADLASRSSVHAQAGGSRALRSEIADIPSEFATVPAVPVVVDLVNDFGLGIAGSDSAAVGVARFVMSQAAALHSPSELVICAAIGEKSRDEWDWLKWLPHVHSAQLPVFPLATDQHHVIELLDALDEATATVRHGASTPAAEENRIGTHYLLLLDDGTPLERSRIVPFLRRMKNRNFSFIWVSEQISALPRPCGAVAQIDRKGATATVSIVESGTVHDRVSIELLSRKDAENMARRLAPMVDVTHEAAEGSIPPSVSLADLLGGDDVLDDPLVIQGRWHESELSVGKKSAGLRAAVGMAGAPLTIDIRRDGPHALVAGTTGAGKSEFLQTWVASLAASHKPERVNFLFVDYKGGSAFKDCIDLPHTVGLVTDLDAHQVQRALTSLNAELHRRERILNAADAKDLVQMEERGHPDTPPNLLIIVDEFAALAKEVPEFVDGVVNIAQRGRSLGLHLVLATQRPAGVITDNIRANTNLRIALRMADEEESSDVVGSAIAATFSRDNPGRGVARIGPNELVVFQSGFAGARTGSRSQGPQISIGRLRFDGIEPVGGTGPELEDVSTEDPIDLERLVDAVSSAHRNLGGRAPRRPWQEPLPELVDLHDPAFPKVGTTEKIYIGVRDDPELQGRSWVTLNPELEGSWLIVGTSGSGKTVFLRTVAASLGIGSDAGAVDVYGLDFGGRGLRLLEDLPYVGSVIAGADTERVVRLLRQLDRTIEQRSDLFATVRAGSLEEYRASVDDGASMRRVFILLDGTPAFLQVFERLDRGVWADALPRLVAAGRQVGVHFLLTSDRRLGLPLALTSNIQRVFTLRLASDDDYRASGVPADVLTPRSSPGRFLDGDHEAQLAVPGGSRDGAVQGRAVAKLGHSLVESGSSTTSPIEVLPSIIPATQLIGEDGAMPLGMSDVDLKEVAVGISTATFAVFGPSGSGKTTALIRLAYGFRNAVPDGVILFGAARRGSTVEGPWHDFAAGHDATASLLRDGLDRIRSGSSPMIVVDDVTDLLEGEAGSAFTDVVLALREHPGMLVISGNSARARRVYSDGLIEVRSAKTGLLLQPDFDYDGDLLGATISKPGGRIFPTGRGYLIDRASVTLIQVAFDGDVLS